MKIGIPMRLMPLMLMLVAINATSGVRLGSAQQGIATPDASQSSEQCQAKGPVRDIALSPDGRYLLTPWNGANARLWDFKTGAVLHTFSVSQDSNDYVVYVSFSPDGNYALLGTDLGVATLWSVQSGEKVRTFGEAEGLLGQRQIQFSPDGKYILATYTHGAALWDVQSGNEVRSFLADLNLDYTSEFSADGRFLLTQDPPAILWDVQTGQALHTFEYSWAAKISPGGNYVSALTSDGLQIWDAHTYKLVITIEHDDVGVFSPDEKYVLTFPDGNSAGLYDLQTGKQQIIFTFSGDMYYGTFLRQKPYLIVVEGHSQMAVHTWDLATNKEIRNITIDLPLIYGAKYLVVPNGNSIIIASIADPNNLKTDTPIDAWLIQLWDLQTGQLLRSFC